ncbi:9589_t:CDS:2 [Funneliformis mosseae]|uniref:9589_t:CDS:1 n=1 Tax=Funneliformis mosseae TaxID=27381 RepID=A0A9N8V4T7_FUNMO|nr:9589_t:CDS:2 [Funneliformis mosseae]
MSMSVKSFQRASKTLYKPILHSSQDTSFPIYEHIDEFSIIYVTISNIVERICDLCVILVQVGEELDSSKGVWTEGKSLHNDKCCTTLQL